MTQNLTIAQLNALPGEDWRVSLTGVVGVEEWVRAVDSARPYADRDTLLELAEGQVLALSPEQVRAALADHPRIGASTAPGSQAAREQSGVDPADAELAAALREGNLAYEDKFGLIYLVCASGRTGHEMLADCLARLDNDPDAEILVTRRELAAIARKRLERMVTQ
ncbi:2-oxo-4-hydroxy-4-carboxy-5-ureidoimidazoline decarboxylase [Nocardia sp. NEAU-G5]|uniref:2-oxo-4-hydroxy-4-carboxy-5-ureidoimidazoline decarboxylase n=1 Tax=Nocardia albiluteola TaxID=2842303 RepID=A0ABS6AX58_9NOCA|nr:2-oxo-4-hydroxy-4-carboxy-5-ureidoimidazoline decarboxylase [Nocardia albiluteola]MBU3062637.1 2-oxo-4-hydroxy-4-carboxy-5-ureidoimidazoline decarboxylase [Nocardia albiluteola]MBU3065529.1 2-oxo-4-hydroxy-4-carboxy-5-ureidoimidazoline decarboxylase [Nocardia albiluteola]